MAVHIVCRPAGQEDDGPHQVGGLTPAGRGDVLDDPAAGGGIGPGRLGDRGPDDAAIVEGRAVFSGTDEAADSVLQATGQGAESFEVLRAATASPSLRWRVILPDGWTVLSER